MGLTYRMDGKLFNFNRLRSRAKTSTTSVIELQYRDDAEVSAHLEAELQTIIDVLQGIADDDCQQAFVWLQILSSVKKLRKQIRQIISAGLFWTDQLCHWVKGCVTSHKALSKEVLHRKKV